MLLQAMATHRLQRRLVMDAQVQGDQLRQLLVLGQLQLQEDGTERTTATVATLEEPSDLDLQRGRLSKHAQKSDRACSDLLRTVAFKAAELTHPLFAANAQEPFMKRLLQGTTT